MCIYAYSKVDHLDTQIHIYDSRKSENRGYSRRSDCSFGYRAEDVPGRPRTRFTKGSTKFCYFVRGYHDGTICLWDYRNCKVCKFGAVLKLSSLPSICQSPVASQRQRDTEIVHTLCTDDEFVAFGGDTVSFMDFSLNMLPAQC